MVVVIRVFVFTLQQQQWLQEDPCLLTGPVAVCCSRSTHLSYLASFTVLLGLYAVIYSCWQQQQQNA